MKKYNIWIEGYATNGMSAKAEYLGSYYAFNFRMACAIACMVKGHGYNAFSNTSWGCSLYDNEKDAREFFG